MDTERLNFLQEEINNLRRELNFIREHPYSEKIPIVHPPVTSSSVVVAASDADLVTRAFANFTCVGTRDEETIQLAIDY